MILQFHEFFSQYLHTHNIEGDDRKPGMDAGKVG